MASPLAGALLIPVVSGYTRRAMRIIGVDCAVAPEKTGVAVGHWDRETGGLTLERTARGSEAKPPVAIILDAVEEDTLLALDAPLGWPEAFSRHLASHEAGAGIAAGADRFFRRRTDEEIARRLGKRPMDVAADRIGRTAFAALSILTALRQAGRLPATLAWSPDEAARGVHAVETYPAGLLKARGLPAQGYKRPEQRRVRQEILHALEGELEIRAPREELLEDPDQLDALLCALGAADFLNRLAPGPEDLDLARKEGWIWVRR
ncbi:MAG: DUF429 domain-containing protein [Alkalispirochaetaceae bacterium]